MQTTAPEPIATVASLVANGQGNALCAPMHGAHVASRGADNRDDGLASRFGPCPIVTPLH